MGVTAESRVFLLPRDHTEFEFFNVSIAGNQKTLVVSGDAVFEVREVGPSSSFDPRPEPKFPSGEPVKSIIFEAQGSQPGYVKQNANFTCLTKYDVLFLVLCSLKAHILTPSERYKAQEDLLDEVTESINGGQNKVIQKHILDSFDTICDVLEENGDTYYRVQTTKVLQALERKVSALSNLLLQNKSFALLALIEETLGGVELLPSPEILRLQTLKFSVDYIFDSYLSQDLKQLYYIHMKIDSSALDTFVSERQKQQRARTVVEENSAAVSKSKSTAKGSNSVKATKKKVAVKVAVGKGALDSFFGQRKK